MRRCEEVKKIQWPKVWRDHRGKLEGVSEEVEKIQWTTVWRDQTGKLEGVSEEVEKIQWTKFEETRELNEKV
jgi:preprotein translocase subunit SecE